MGGFGTVGDDGDDRMKIIETRLGVTEKSNRALLEEVIRLQGELRIMVQKNESSIKEERVSRQQIESSMQMVNDLISKLSSRIKAAEEKILEEKTALTSLVSHTKGVEQAVVAGQQSLAAKKDVQTSKIQELTMQLNDIQRSRDQLEKVTFNLNEELRTIRTKVDSQTLELSSTVNDLKLRSRRLEEENKVQLDTLRKQGDLYNSSETNTTHLRGQVESRLSELRDVIMELRNRQDQEASDRRSLEQQIQQRVNTLQQNLAEQNRKREEAMHAMDMIHREKEHTAENDKLRLQGKLTETVEELNKRLLTKEIKLREELQEKYTQLERMIHHEQQIRQKYEATLREENEKRWNGLKKLSDEEMVTVRETFQSERHKNKEAIQKLDESISLIEKQLAEQKKQTDKVVAAEIKSRKQHEKSTYEKLDHLNEKLSLATASLQTAIGGVTGNFASHTDKLRTEMKTMVATSEQASTRAMTDMDARVQSMKQRVNNLEQQLDGRISERSKFAHAVRTKVMQQQSLETILEDLRNQATAILAQNLREKVESISLWQDVTSQTIRELNQSIQGLPNDIFAIEEKQKLLKSEMDSRLTTETDARIREVETLKHEVSMLKNKRQPQAATIEDMQEVQASVRKLAESVQTVKTVVGMKIQSEQKLRLSGLEDLQIQINRLKSQAGMHSGMNSTLPLYMRPDTDPGFMDNFLTQDITQDIYGRSPYAQPTTRNDMESTLPVTNGYAAQYSKSKGAPREDLSKTSHRPLDTVTEAEDSQGDADWNLLSKVAYGSHEGEAERKPTPDRACMNQSRQSLWTQSRGKTPLREATPDGGWGETLDRGVTPNQNARKMDPKQTDHWKDEVDQEKIAPIVVSSHDKQAETPLDRATNASLKGAHPTLSDIVGSRDTAMTGEIPGDNVNERSATSDPKDNQTARSNRLEWTPATPDGKKRSPTFKDNDTDTRDEKQPMPNTLEWQPATPDSRLGRNPSRSGEERNISRTTQERNHSRTRQRNPSRMEQERNHSRTSQERNPSRTSQRNPSRTEAERNQSRTEAEKNPIMTNQERNPSRTSQGNPSRTNQERNPSRAEQEQSPVMTDRERNPSRTSQGKHEDATSRGATLKSEMNEKKIDEESGKKSPCQGHDSPDQGLNQQPSLDERERSAQQQLLAAV